ncbi:MetQ/NlpA family ABC transporter substrate-binding protein [Lihuaxuella thermophila]|uniref:D-methionine transport system substrate-binding protein n=1 Tax=Lihuaxuella thermophila TaxID=1173111 RepID=A0A1H8B9V4_9BACL|nr:MetQ/NlpA family ABC transporter substrate-binding protein [Lihuaxuella thermophila]SEM78808.1 D-methionine transport system substrate-binding protein [Lihuaxuella thermophila]
MKKIAALLVAAAVAVFGSACAAKKDEAATLTVGATQVPHAEILEHLKPQLEKQGVKLEVKVFQDYVLPNKAVEEGQLDANYFQHIPWMTATNKEKGYHLVKVAGVHIEPMGAYSRKIKDINQLKNGATVAIPNATSELTRVLLLLDSQKLIQLDNREGDKTLKNIKSNPKNLQFKLLEPAVLPRVLDQVDFAVINTNYALQAKLNPVKDSLFIEGKESPYVNVLATKQGNEKNEALQKLAKALTSPETKKFIEKKYKGAVVPAF